MRRASLFILALTFWQVVPAHALDLNHLPAWVRSALTPLCIDWQQVRRDSEATPLPAPFVTGGLLPVYTPSYGIVQNLPAPVAVPTRAKPTAMRTVGAPMPGPVSCGTGSSTVPKPASGGGDVLKGIGAVGTVGSPLATVEAGSAKLPATVATRAPDAAGSSALPRAVTVGGDVLNGVGTVGTAGLPLATVKTGSTALPAPVGGAVLPGMVAAGSSPLSSVSTVSGGAPDLSALKPAPAPGFTRQLHANPVAAQALLMRMKTLLEQGEIDEARLPKWLAEQKIERPLLVQALDQMTLEHPMNPIYLPVCRLLWEGMGGSLDECLKLPCRVRIIMGMYVATLDKEDEAKKILSSVPEEWQKHDTSVPMYHVACELLDWQRKAPRLCIWAWKWGATMKGAADQAFVCWHVAQACRVLQDKDAVRSELLPWCESALERPGSESRWDYAIRELLWGHEFNGDRSKGIERACHWLSLAPQRGVSPAIITPARFVLAQAMARDGRVKEADELLRQVTSADASGFLCNRARAEMCELRRGHADLPELGFEPLVVEDAAKAGVDFGTVSVDRLNRRTFLLFSYTPISVRVRCDQAFLQASCGVSRVNERGLFERRIICTIDSSKLVPGNLSARLSIETEDQWGGTVELIVPVSAHLDNG